MTKVGLPGAATGLQKEGPTIAKLLKAEGDATGQFGKNHLAPVARDLAHSATIMPAHGASPRIRRAPP